MPREVAIILYGIGTAVFGVAAIGPLLPFLGNWRLPADPLNWAFACAPPVLLGPMALFCGVGLYQAVKQTKKS